MKKVLSMALAAIMLMGMMSISFAEEIKMDYEIIIAPQYEAAGYFYNGLARVKKDGKWGYIDEAGNMLIAPEYDYAGNFYEGKALVGKAAEPLTGEDSNVLITMGFVDTRGGYTPFMALEDGAYTEWKINYMDMLFDYDMDMEAYNLNEPKNIGFNEGYLTLVYMDSCSIFAENGYEIDRNLGNWEYEGCEYEMELWGYHSDGLFEATSYDWYPYTVFVDKAGNVKVKASCTYNELIDDKYLLTSWYPFVDGYALCWVTSPNVGNGGNMVAILDKAGNLVVPGPYDLASVRFKHFNNLPNAISEGRITLHNYDIDKWGAVDIKGEIQVPFIYNNMTSYHEGLAGACKDGKWGYIDVKGNVMIDFIYDDITLFNNGVALVIKEGAPLVIDRYGNALSGSEKVPVDCYIKDGGTSYTIDDIIIVKENDKYGYASLSYKTALPKVEEMSAWAYPEVTEAIEKNLIPAYLQNQYFENIKREDFAELIVKALEEATGKDAETLLYERCGIEKLDIYKNNPFKDTSKSAVIIAHKLGIINGVSATEFAPNNYISRQDAAALLMRAAKLIKGDLAVNDSTFADNGAIADYAKQAVSYVTTLKIMNGVGDNKFDPTATYTREQAYITILRLFKSLV